jgi:hypothetical protein
MPSTAPPLPPGVPAFVGPRLSGAAINVGPQSATVSCLVDLITHKNATDAQRAQAREWWKSAKTYGGAVANLEQAVDDRYDLEKDLAQ